MAVLAKYVFICFSFIIYSVNGVILCESGFCRTFTFEVGCAEPAPHCGLNNGTHTGMRLDSPTTCNCCEFCLPFIVADDHCSTGGPGTGVTVGRCGPGLTCERADDGFSYCTRMESPCHTAQDRFDERHQLGQLGSLEQRPVCDGKARYSPFYCIPAHTCFCQSEDGDRLFGEVLNMGVVTQQNMHCGCSRVHEKIRKSIGPGVPFPVIGPRCTSDGNFNPVQCLDRICHCVNRVTGVIQGNQTIDLDEQPLSRLPCYNPDLDLFPEQNIGEANFTYTTPCFERMDERIELMQQSLDEGFNVEFFSDIPECLPDGTFGRVMNTRNGTRICVDEWGDQIENYKAEPRTPQYDTMDCKCAQTSLLMSTSVERPVCCKNGNYRRIQCRRGQCYCVDSDGRQIEREATDITTLSCYNANEDWRIC